MQTIQNDKDKLILRMDRNEPLANAIRRSVSEIPTLAIDEVEIFKNDSALYDEVVAHRLGLIPLKTEKSMSKKTKVTLKLTATGPGTVYAESLKGPVTIVQPKIPITILNENHKLELVATATLGTAREHAKHLPGLCYYHHLKEVKSSPQIDKIIQNSKGVIKPEKKGSKWLCNITESDMEDIEKSDKTAIEDSNEIIFIIESYGNMSAKDILTEAEKALESNLEDFEKEIK
jgi:DNA-directed RNA polymerase subunit D